MTKTNTTAKATAAKRIKFAKFANKDGTLNGNIATKVVRMRDKQLMSWVQIGLAIGSTPRMALRIYDARLGEGQHHGLLPGKGGRLPEPKHCSKCQNPDFYVSLEEVG